MKDAFAKIWNHWYFQDALVGLLVIGIVLGVLALRRRVYWRLAFKQVFRRPVIWISFILLTLYVLVAILDSVGYYPYMRDDAGNVRVHAKTGTRIRDPKGISLLDKMLTPLRESKEKTYSAPLATRQFTKQYFTGKDGKTVYDHPPLKHPRKHLFGTDRVGTDVLYRAIKSIRTGMILGAFTTVMVVPLAIIFGVLAGYLGKWADDIIQYVYTVLASIPSVLLIAAFMILSGQGLAQLCIIMGITSWTGLCRVLRGEAMKLREMEYVQAAKATGVPSIKIMLRHIVPNLMHVALITAVLSFSGRVLSEAVLTYIGIGVGADTISWGGMINDSLRELARDPLIWWNLVAAFIFMLGLVLPANLFGDALRDALDPRLRTQ